MVQVYVWLMVAVVLAVGVLVLAAMVSPGGSAEDETRGSEPQTFAQRFGGAGDRAWEDFRSGMTTLGARIKAALDAVVVRVAERRSGAPADSSVVRVSVMPGVRPARPDSPPAARADRPARDAWSAEEAVDTTMDDFFAGAQTSEPAYLDTVQLSDTLHGRR